MARAALSVATDRLALGDVAWPERVAARVRRDVPLAVLDLGIVLACYLVPLVIRFNGDVPARYWRNFWLFAPVAAAIHLVANHGFRLYGSMWRYASIREARQVMTAGLAAWIAVLAAAQILGAWRHTVPLSVAALGPVLSLVGFGAVRFQSRLFALRRQAIHANPTRLLVVGAGDASSKVLQDIQRNPELGLDPVGIVDDDPRKLGLSLHGLTVLGSRAAIPFLTERLRVGEVLMAIPSATGEIVREVAALCQEAGVRLRALPSIREIVDGRVTARDIRDLRIEDLLGRQQVETDLAAVRAIIRERRVLVTGAGGSIGSEIIRQVASFQPSSLILLDHDETHLHDLLSEVESSGRTEVVLADIRDRDRTLAAFMRHQPDVVFHAAAHKHVHLLEAHPEEAVATNILGTANVAEAASLCGTERFVLISTDKAVKPESIMGASKWFAEQIVRTLHGNGCRYSAVRFGNVLGSRGSVIPTFFRQIASGGPVTVTDPSMARYFMSVGEAVQLVLQASALAEGADVFTLDMGQPVNILDLARKVIALSGRVPGRDVDIQIIGPRAGEKLVEDLMDPDEDPAPTRHPSIFVSHPPAPSPASVRSAIRELQGLADQGSREALGRRLKELTQTARVPAPTGAGA